MEKQEKLLELVTKRISWDTYSYVKKPEIEKPLKSEEKEILESDTWAKYLDFDDLEQLRNEIILKLIQTSTSFAEIKRSLL